MRVVKYHESDLPGMIDVWNEIVRAGRAFPQEEELDIEGARAFFASQTHCAVAKNADNKVLGLYILHPNNVGRCGHICNASYAVTEKARKQGIGRALLMDSLEQAKKHGFAIMQFNAVVADNINARKLYESVGFTALGAIPAGFRNKTGNYDEIRLYYKTL